jgi:uncharacterized protein
MQNKTFPNTTLLSLSLFTGFLALGAFLYKGLKTFSDKDRVVTVKGLAEMEMKATSATLVLSASLSGDDLPGIIERSRTRKMATLSYLASIGYDTSLVLIPNLDVIDRQGYYETQWENGQRVQIKIDRYTINQELTVPSMDVSTTEDQAARIKLDLVSKDLTSNVTTTYTFPELNSIKPQLIAESTKNARIAGEQFANDSQAELGKIKTASQGQITIAGKYYYNEEDGGSSDTPQEPYIQKARVVSTIVFFLE